MSAARMEGVVKTYGATVALAGLDLDIPSGSVTGLIGPNGAGKTTAFGVLTGLVRASRGTIDVLGDGPFDPRRHRGRVSLLPQDCMLNPYLPVAQLLEYFARLQGLSAHDARREVGRVLEVVELGDRARDRVHQLSHGMRRRVAIAQALIGTPALILLDEPMSGLDPHLVVRVREVLQHAARTSTIVISSHILSELEAICSHVIFIDSGRTVRSGAVEDITGARQFMRIRLSAPLEPERLAALALAEDVRIDGDTLVVLLEPGARPEETNARILPRLLEAGLGVLEIQLGQSLEDSYMQGLAAGPGAQP